MDELGGRVLSAADGRPLPAHRVDASWRERRDVDGDAVLVPARSSATTDEEGRFRLLLTDADDSVVGGVQIDVRAPDGTVLASRAGPIRELGSRMRIEVEPLPPAVVRPAEDAPDPTRPHMTGTVVDRAGKRTPASLPVALWGVADDGAGGEGDPVLLVSTATAVGGYFSAEHPRTPVVRAYGIVAGATSAIPVVDGLLPVRVLLVVDLSDEYADDCDCDTRPPRTPELEDLAEGSAAFSTDLGQCVDLTMPNRVVEEVAYLKVVRVSEPDIRGLSSGPHRPLPRAAVASVVKAVMTLQRADDEDDDDQDGDDGQVREARGRAGVAAGLKPSKLKVDAHIASRLLSSPGQLSEAMLRDADRLTEFDRVAELVKAVQRGAAGRAPLSGAEAIDWDETPTIFQATTIASGHLLQFRQVWRADGYSLGDLLYSLPLAPGQKKRISILEWDRRDTGSRTEMLAEEEHMQAFLSRDRDIAEITNSHLRERTSGGSSVETWAGGGGIGAGFTTGAFGIFAGVAGGGGGSSSTSWQDSGRTLSADSLQQIRDRTLQSASSVRTQRSSVVQAVAQGEDVRAETETVANYNHCHAMTLEYFEVLRHFTVSHELVHVQECLFVPLPMTYFDLAKVLRWREQLARGLRDRSLSGGFAAAERVARNWEGYDFPENSYAEGPIEELEGELRISFLIPRPRDADDEGFQVHEWQWLQAFLDYDPFAMWLEKLNERTQVERDRIFRTEIAPGIAQRLVQRLRFSLVTSGGSQVSVHLDATLVSRFTESTPLYVSIRGEGRVPPIPRDEITRFRIFLAEDDFPEGARVVVHSGRVRYDTEHLRHALFDEPRINNDVARGDDVVVSTPLSRAELRNPRQDDRELVGRLVKHLDEHVEHYHQIIWLTMDPNRRYMLLDGFLAPNANGRSVASVVENRVIGIVGNCLVMPVAPGNVLAPPLVDEQDRPVPLIRHYSAAPPPPIRVAVPTRGIFAEAVMGECNSCERMDEGRFWRWEEAPILESPPEIAPLSTDTRAEEPPDTTPTPLPPPVIAVQNAPALPDPVGLGQAFSILGRSDLFKDVTGLVGNQNNALAAFKGALDTARVFGGAASNLALQHAMSRDLDRTLEQIAQAEAHGLIDHDGAREAALAALRGAIGVGASPAPALTEDGTVNRAIDAATQAERGDVSVTTPDERVEVSFDDGDSGDPGAGVLTGASFSAGAIPDADRWIDLPIALDELSGLSPWFTYRVDLPSDNRSLFDAMGPTVYDAFKAIGWLRDKPGTTDRFQVRLRLRFRFPTRRPGGTTVAGTGRFPLVVFAHGNHRVLKGGVEVGNHEGYSYAQDRLAEDGFISVSVDQNIAAPVNSLVELRADLVLAAIDEMRRRASVQGDVFFGRVDFNKVLLVGHSRGGDAVIRAAEKNATRGKKAGLKAVLAVAPTDMRGCQDPARRPHLERAHTDQLVVLYGTHDGDVRGIETLVVPGSATQLTAALGPTGTGFRHYDRARTMKSFVFVDGCTHNRFNSVWMADTGDETGIDPTDITSGRVRSEAVHQAILKEHVVDLGRWRLKGDNSKAVLFDGRRANAAGVPARLLWNVGERTMVVEDFENPANNLLGGQRHMQNSTREAVDLLFVAGARVGQSVPHQTIVLHADLTTATPLPQPPVLVTDIPPAKKDWRQFDTLVFDIGRLIDVTSAATITASARPLMGVTLRDGAGGAQFVDQSTLFTASVPGLPAFRSVRISGALHNGTHNPLETVAVPLSAFSPVDLANVAAFEVHYDPAGGGHHFIERITVLKRR